NSSQPPVWPPAWLRQSAPPTATPPLPPVEESAANGPTAPPEEACGEAPQPTWDQAEAERLVSELCAEIRRPPAPSGDPSPAALANVFDTWNEVANALIANHEAEHARGFDVLEALRHMPDNVRQSVANWRAAHESTTCTPQAEPG